MYEEIISKEDRADIDLLHGIAMRHAQKQDGQDADVIEGIQKIQKVIMCRAGGTAYLLAKKHDNEQATASGTAHEPGNENSEGRV